MQDLVAIDFETANCDAEACAAISFVYKISLLSAET